MIQFFLDPGLIVKLMEWNGAHPYKWVYELATVLFSPLFLEWSYGPLTAECPEAHFAPTSTEASSAQRRAETPQCSAAFKRHFAVGK